MLMFHGNSYYQTSLLERFYHSDHIMLKPSGVIGHGLGILGSLLMLIGVVSYMARKRMKRLSRLGLLKHWLEFHIFLCTLGPILVLFHTSFKFGGLVSVSFWSMVAVFLSGVIGRFIYIQIPRTIEGRELSLQEVKSLKTAAGQIEISEADLPDEIITPELNGSILPGITRNSVIALAEKWQDKSCEKKISIDELMDAHASGKLQEVFGAGTAAVISPVGEIKYGDKVITIGGGEVGPVAKKYYNAITDIQYGQAEDHMGWIEPVS